MSYSLNLNTIQTKIIIDKYSEYMIEHTNNYTLFRAKFKSCTLTIFKTNVLLLQGKDETIVYNEIAALLGIETINEQKPQATYISFDSIGSDEVGTGDFFGPVIVVSCLVKATDIPLLSRLGVKDSKEITDEKILQIAPILMEKLTYAMHILDNLKFNYLTFKCSLNMNTIKAIMHNSAILNLLKKTGNCDEIIIDAFTTSKKYFEYLKTEKNIVTNVKLIEKAENQYFSVAAASIIARYQLIKEFDKLSLSEGIKLPKGAGSKVDTIIERIYKTKGEKYLYNIGKCNFKNLEKVKAKI